MAEIIAFAFAARANNILTRAWSAARDGLIVETASGLEYAQCVRGNFTLAEAELAAPLRPVVRAATEEDLAVVEKNREKEVYAFRVCQEKILEHKLDMKLVSVECSFEGTKILFFFTSDGRVDFRGLVKSLAAVFHTGLSCGRSALGMRPRCWGLESAASLLLQLLLRGPAGLHQDGQDPKPLPEPHQDFRHLRPGHVLPEV
ncbi:MAG: regulatory iron-sulfur-containing complex subunit RicT [Evtepia gabavorous]